MRKTTPRKRKGEFPITEKAVPLVGWPAGSRRGRREAIAREIGDLKRQLNEAAALPAEKEREHTESLRRLLLALLEVMDAFEGVFVNISTRKELCTPQMNIWVGNFRTPYKMLKRTLLEQGITPIENLQEGFNPHWHKVTRKVFDLSRPAGTIIAENQRGYIWRGQVLRPADVTVVTHDKSEENTPPEPDSP